MPLEIGQQPINNTVAGDEPAQTSISNALSVEPCLGKQQRKFFLTQTHSPQESPRVESTHPPHRVPLATTRSKASFENAEQPERPRRIRNSIAHSAVTTAAGVSSLRRSYETPREAPVPERKKHPLLVELLIFLCFLQTTR